MRIKLLTFLLAVFVAALTGTEVQAQWQIRLRSVGASLTTYPRYNKVTQGVEQREDYLPFEWEDNNEFVLSVPAELCYNPYAPDAYECSNLLNVDIQVTATYVGPGSPPEEVKLRLLGEASTAAWPTIYTLEADNGLGHTPRVEEINGVQQVTCAGSRYRSFRLSGREITFTTKLHVYANSFGPESRAGDILVRYRVDVVNWALNVLSDRESTYRREEDPKTGRGYQVLNKLEGDSKMYGDTTFDNPDWGPLTPPVFTGAFRGVFSGPWSPLTTWNWSASNLDVIREESDPFQLLTWLYTQAMEPMPVSFQTPIRTGRVNLRATDLINGFNDDATYVMRIHLPAERLREHRLYDGMLHNYPSPADPDPWAENAYYPLRMFGETNATSVPQETSYRILTRRTYSFGYRFTVNGGANLSAELATVNFGAESTWDTNEQWQVDEQREIRITLPPMTRFRLYVVVYGTVSNWDASRWGARGYVNDSLERVTTRANAELYRLELPLEGQDYLPGRQP